MLDRFDLGIPADAVSPEDRRRIRIVVLATLGLVGVALAALFQNLAIGNIGEVWALLAGSLAGLANLALLKVTRRSQLGAHLGLAILTAVMAYTQVGTGGFYDPNFAWLYAVPLAAAAAVDLRGAAVWMAITIAITLGFWGADELGVTFPSRVPEDARAFNALTNRVLAILAIGSLAVGFVSGQRRAERELARANRELFLETAYVQLLQHAVTSANEATSLEQAMRDAVTRICGAMGWVAGHIFTLRDDGQLASSGFFHFDDPERFAALRRLTSSTRIREGEGLPGRALASRHPEYLGDLGEGALPRGNIGLELGLRSAFAIPVMVNGKVRAVLEFGSTKATRPDERLLEVFRHIGEQLGRVGERSSLQEHLRRAQKLEAVGQLAAGVAHEINNPMSYVRSNLHALRSEWQELSAKHSGSDGEELQRFTDCEELIEDSLEGVERTISIIRDVKDFSHSGQAGQERYEEADLAELLDGALRVAAAHASVGVRVMRNYEPLGPIRCAPNQLRQVFVNLVVNALHAIGERGQLTLAIARHDDEVRVRVEDDGHGMSPATRERLFDPFFTTKPVGEGTGLGLYVSYEIVRSHGGRIVVSSEPGSGASFEVRLPG